MCYLGHMVKAEEHSCLQCESLKNSSFTDLSEADLDTLNRQKVCNLYRKGQVLFHEGNLPLGLYCLKQGKIKIFKTGVDGKEQIVRLASPGDLMGYRSFLGEETYSASAAALEDSVICFIDKNNFKKTLDDNTKLSKTLLELLSHELREAENLIRDMAQKSVRERLAEVLLILKEKFGMESDDPKCLSAKLSREELANYVGTATETAIRLISDLKDEKVIETQGKRIRILNAERLTEIANLAD